MGTRGWVRYEPKYYNDTPEILRYVGLIRLVNGQLPNQRPRPKPPIRQLRNRVIMSSSSARASKKRLFRRKNCRISKAQRPLVANREENIKLLLPEIPDNRVNITYTNGMLVWIKLLEQLWWPGVVVSEGRVEKLRHKYINIAASVYYTENVADVYNRDHIKPYGCAEKEEYVSLGKSTLSKRDSGKLKADHFKQTVDAFDEVQRIVEQSSPIRTQYPAGSKVWFKLCGRCWWPGVVLHSDKKCPLTGEKCKTHHIVLCGHKIIHVINHKDIVDYEKSDKVKYKEYVYGYLRKYGHSSHHQSNHRSYDINTFTKIINTLESCIGSISDTLKLFEALDVIF